MKRIRLKVEISQLKNDIEKKQFEKYKFEDGYMNLLWKDNESPLWNWYGFITSDELKERIGEKRHKKFHQGQRIFIVITK